MIRSPLLSDLPGVAHGFFTREGGVSEGIYASLNIGLGSRDDRDRVMANRGRVATALGVAPGRLAMPYQVHSPDVVVVEEAWAPGEGPKADAVVTARPGVAVGVATADCGPILFADARARVVGAAHAGWQGAFHGVIEATVAAMEGLGASRGGITAVLGPTISGEAYEVGPEFVERFVAREAGWARFFRPSGRVGHAMFDLPAFIALRLAEAGVGAAGDLALCTYAQEERFFSYRRTTHRGEPDYGRLVSAIALVA
ncbi:peptidoglycan editing factor PgeF [Pinisolibacter aquiterrae]|uniref:peptidoglycan editing factor PgeF n=1 Tax=Pinisolibacter aquiterrae TaxID=2815579 RepID=UPI001C3C89C6|nr:peptidoglycan editing factor PgeF [Pinisolibacter aquiterrae]MCC8237561.1 peptidoglycan editing factor PgeF [Pinisolibacter aquiterrae]